MRPDDDHDVYGVRCRRVCASVAPGLITILTVFTQSVLSAAVITPPTRAYATELDSAGSDASPPGKYAKEAWISREELWTQVLGLLNEHDGAVTKERFEQAFGVQFTIVYRDKDATIYQFKAGKNFDVGMNITYNNQNKVLGPLGGHSELVINWGPEHGGDVQHACLTAAHVQAGLLASGWTSPWQGWGRWEELAKQTAKNLQEHAPPGGYMYPPLMPQPRATFWRRGPDESDSGDRLPKGEVFSSGDFADSCVTGIRMTATLQKSAVAAAASSL